jgi:CPA2 family monovalent cation:H+ antiporter-2
LAQFGEFGFVLSRLAQAHGVVDDRAVRPLFAAGIASMFLTPLLVRIAPHITAGERLLAPLERLIGVRAIDEADATDAAHRALSGHVVIVGHGVAGKLAARTLQTCDVPFVVLELNADTVRAAKGEGLPVYYGDATSEEALGHAHLETARLMVLLMNDPLAAMRVVDTVRRVAPHVPVVMRTRYLAERAALIKMGARDVVAEEVEGGVEIISRVLRMLQIPRNLIETHIHKIRSETQASERKLTMPRLSLRELPELDDLKIESALVRPESRAAAASAIGMNLQNNTGALVVGVRRAGQLLARFDPSQPFHVDDVAYLVGTSEAIRRALPLFDAHELEPGSASA